MVVVEDVKKTVPVPVTGVIEVIVWVLQEVNVSKVVVLVVSSAAERNSTQQEGGKVPSKTLDPTGNRTASWWPEGRLSSQVHRFGARAVYRGTRVDGCCWQIR